MRHSTTNTYQLKREIIGFSKRLSSGASKDQKKFAADMIYGILGSGSCVLAPCYNPVFDSCERKKGS